MHVDNNSSCGCLNCQKGLICDVKTMAGKQQQIRENYRKIRELEEENKQLQSEVCHGSELDNRLFGYYWLRPQNTVPST